MYGTRPKSYNMTTAYRSGPTATHASTLALLSPTNSLTRPVSIFLQPLERRYSQQVHEKPDAEPRRQLFQRAS